MGMRPEVGRLFRLLLLRCAGMLLLRCVGRSLLLKCAGMLLVLRWVSK